MSAITFDTPKFAHRLLEIAGQDLVTREYLDTRLIQLEQRMIIKLGGLMVAAVGIVATLVKIL